LVNPRRLMACGDDLAFLGTLPRPRAAGLGPGILDDQESNLPETVHTVVLLAAVDLRGQDSPGRADNPPESEVSG